jgi:hypothetical protein
LLARGVYPQAAKPLSAANGVGTLLTLRLACKFKNTLLDFSRNPHTRIA